MLCAMSINRLPSHRRMNSAIATALALALTAVVALLTTCSNAGELPTLVPTLSLPTVMPTLTANATRLPVLTNTLLSLETTWVISYDFDPATGQMVPVERLSGVTVDESDRLWVVTENAFVEYHRVERAAPVASSTPPSEAGRGTGMREPISQGSHELVAFKVITYTYDDVGRRVGWTVTWPQGPTVTQRLVFLYEGLVAVGERLRVGDSVTTTYYSWAARDRNTTVDAFTSSADAPITDVARYDARCQAAAEMDCLTIIAKVIVSEASVGNKEEQRAVAWTFRNRLDRGLSLLSFAMDRTPNREWYLELAREVLTAPAEADVTKGATHFFSPRSMPLQGEEHRCKGQGGIYDCDGGLVFVEGLDKPAYAPFWHLLYEWLPVPGIRKTHFLFYRIPPIRPRVGQ